MTIWPAAILTLTDWPGAAFASALPSAEIVKPGPAATTRTVCPADTDAALFSMSWRSGRPAAIRASAVARIACAGSVITASGSTVRSPSRATRSAALSGSPGAICRAAT
ncbi:hypothetical protein FEP53_05133 [Burkholderia multivorans]|nr:hypothetical protein [Burkholderia multivorans]